MQHGMGRPIESIKLGETNRLELKGEATEPLVSNVLYLRPASSSTRILKESRNVGRITLPDSCENLTRSFMVYSLSEIAKWRSRMDLDCGYKTFWV